LHFKRSDVDPTIHDAIKTRTALIIERRRREGWVTRVDGRAARQECLGEGWSAVVLQWAEQWIGVDLITGTG
jgi:hypothetical protein